MNLNENITTTMTFAEIANMGLAIGVVLAGALSVFYIFMGGISFILSAGDEEKIRKAVHTIRYAIIGLVVTIFAVVIVAILGSIFNFDLVSYLRWDTIKEMMNNIITTLTQSQAPINGEGGSLY